MGIDDFILLSFRLDRRRWDGMGWDGDWVVADGGGRGATGTDRIG